MALLKRGRQPSFWNPKFAPVGQRVEIDRGHRLGHGIVCYVAPSTGNGFEDISRNRAPLTPNAGPTWANTAIGPAPSLNGTSQYLSGSDAGLPSGSADRTISVWFSTRGTTGTRSIFAYGTAGTTNYLMAYLVNTALTVGNSNNYLTGGAVSDTKLHHLVTSLTGPNTWTGFLDGVALTPGALTPTTTLSGATGLRLGNYLTNIDWLDGTVDNFIVYNRALNTDEQLQLFREPFAALKPVQQRRYVDFGAGGGTVFFLANSGAVSFGRGSASPATPNAAKSLSIGAGRAPISPATTLAAHAQADGKGGALSSPSAPLAARTQADAAGRSSPAPSVPLAARTESSPSGRANAGLTAPSAAKTSGQARGNAAAGGVSQLSGSARTQSASVGRATGSAATSLSGRTAIATGGKAAAAPSAALSSKTQAGSRASATAGGVSQLSASARAAGLAAGRAAPSLGAAVAGHARSNGAVKASSSPSATATARTQGGARGIGFAGGVSQLSAAGTTRGRAAGRAAIAISAAISASTISRGAMRSGLASGTALVAVGRSMAFGHAINGDQNPVTFDVGHFAPIPGDARFATILPDSRFVTLRGV